MTEDIEIDFDLKGTLEDLKKQLESIKETMENTRCKCDDSPECCETAKKAEETKEPEESKETVVGSGCPYSKDSKAPGKCPYLLEMYADKELGTVNGLENMVCFGDDCQTVSKCPMLSGSGSMLTDLVMFVLMVIMFIMMIKSTMRMFE